MPFTQSLLPLESPQKVPRPNQFTHPWTNEEIEFVQSNIRKLTYHQMSKVMSRTIPSIQSKVRYLPLKQKIKKYEINSNYFKKWTPEMAYVLGFIASDGNVSKHGNAHMLQIACDDKDVIEKIRVALRGKRPILEKGRFNGKVSYQFRVSDIEIFNDLLSLGITPRKSLTLKAPIISKKFVPHYLRGFFDGDGSVSVSRSGNITSTWYTASLSMGEFLFNVTKNICPEFKGKIQKLSKNKGYFYSITLGKRDSLLLFKFLYKDATIYMERKYRKFVEGLYGN